MSQRRNPRDWLTVAIRMAEEVDREIERHGHDIDLYWIQDKMRDIVWHCRGATDDPGPRVSIYSQPPRSEGARLPTPEPPTGRASCPSAPGALTTWPVSSAFRTPSARSIS